VPGQDLLGIAVEGSGLGVESTLPQSSGPGCRVVGGREAAAAGVEKGVVKARMTVDGSGEVTRVEVLESQPRRVFDRAVVKTLSQWRFNAGTAGRLVEIDVNFAR